MSIILVCEIKIDLELAKVLNLQKLAVNAAQRLSLIK